mgnify:CR=1 FL=1
MATKRYYVSIVDTNSGRKGLLLGPFRSHEQALRNVETGRRLAHKADAFAGFYGFGTCSQPIEDLVLKTVFGLELVRA